MERRGYKCTTMYRLFKVVKQKVENAESKCQQYLAENMSCTLLIKATNNNSCVFSLKGLKQS